MKPAVIALCGPPGAGKSTLTRAILSLKPTCKAIDHDDFPNQTARSIAHIKAWFERGADPNEFPLSELETRLEALSADTSFPALLFETPFGRTHRRTGRFIDYLVWIDVPLEIALSRQILGFCQRAAAAGPQTDKAFSAWLENYLRSYTEIIADMYRRQAVDVRAGADLVLDGLKSPQELAETVLATIRLQS